MSVNAFDLVHPEDLSLTQAEMRKAIEGKLAQAAYRYRHKNGQWIVLETAGTALFDEGEPCVRWCVEPIDYHYDWYNVMKDDVYPGQK